MTHPVLSRIPILSKFVDERFLDHRRRSSSAAGIATILLAVALFEYRFIHDHTWNWDLMTIALAFVVIKLTLFTWYRFND
jgi:uncharacterized membrane protein